MRPWAVAGPLAARLIGIAALFAIAMLAEFGARGPYDERVVRALYVLVVCGFGATLFYGVLALAGRLRLLRAAELAGDGILIAALVYCTGGIASVLTFLFPVWIIYSALRLGSRGAALSLVASVAVWAGLTLGAAAGWTPEYDGSAPPGWKEALFAVGSHTLAFAAVAFLAHRLAREILRGRRELRELGELHKRIVDNVSSGLLTLSSAGTITSFNREAERITGYASNEVLGREIVRLFPEISATLSSRNESEPGISRLETSFESRNGRRLTLGLSCSALRDDRDRAEGHVLIFQDLTHVLHMQEQLQLSQRLAAVGQLAAGMAHEIRNPLASLWGAIELLSAELVDLEPDQKRLIGIVQRETQRLNTLLTDFLAYARPGPVRTKPVALAELLRDIAALAESGEHAPATVELDLDADARVEGDPDQLRQVFWNLVLNAVQAQPARGPVSISLGRGPDGACVEVRDRGPGMAPEVVERVFEPFFTTKSRGTGLGLATVHRLVEAHGGAIAIDSREGEGTAVRVTLPALASSTS